MGNSLPHGIRSLFLIVARNHAPLRNQKQKKHQPTHEMKNSIQQILLAGLIIFPLLAEETPPPPPPAVAPPETRTATPANAKALSPELAALLRFKPKSLKDGSTGGSRVIAATRSGGGPPVKLVALAPSSGGITSSSQPRLWWWQSADTVPGEMEFALTRMDGRPQTVLAVKLGAMKAGYNAIDLSNPSINPTKITLEDKIEYQWTLGCFSQLQKDSVFVRMSRVDDPALAKLLNADPFSSATLTSLSESGNWYELFDTVALLSRMAPQIPEPAAVRTRLLHQVGLQNETKP